MTTEQRDGAELIPERIEGETNVHRSEMRWRSARRRQTALLAAGLVASGLLILDGQAMAVDDQVSGVELQLPCQAGEGRHAFIIDNEGVAPINGNIVGETAVESIAVDCLLEEITSSISSTSTSTTTTSTSVPGGAIQGVEVTLNCNMSGRGVLTVTNNRTAAISGEIRATKDGQTTLLLEYEAPVNDISANVLPASAEDSLLTVTVDGESAVEQRNLDCVANQSSTTSSSSSTTTTTVAAPGGPLTSLIESVVQSPDVPPAARSALMNVLRLLRLLFGWLGL